MSERVVDVETDSSVDDSAVDDSLLAALADSRDLIAAAEVEQLLIVSDWAHAHPATSDTTVLTRDEHPGGEGTPAVAAFTSLPLGVALRISSSRAQALIADTLDLQYRLPRLWNQVNALLLPVWKARRIATATRDLSQEAAGWVDRQLLGKAGSLGAAALDRLIATARAQADPDHQKTREEAAQEHWDVTLTHPQGWAGTSELTAVGDTLTLSDLYTVVNDTAHQLATLDDQTSLGARKVQALALLVAHGTEQQALCLTGEAEPLRRSLPKVRLYLHADLTQVLTQDPDAIGAVETLGPLTIARIKEWVGHSRVTVVPVLDLNSNPWSPRHDPPPRMAEQIVLRDQRCVFPWCTRQASDLDHIEPWKPSAVSPIPGTDPPPGSTHPDNIAPCCRYEHRAKTTGDWTYERLPDGSYLWTGPHGQQALVTHQGSIALN